MSLCSFYHLAVMVQALWEASFQICSENYFVLGFFFPLAIFLSLLFGMLNSIFYLICQGLRYLLFLLYLIYFIPIYPILWLSGTTIYSVLASDSNDNKCKVCDKPCHMQSSS